MNAQDRCVAVDYLSSQKGLGLTITYVNHHQQLQEIEAKLVSGTSRDALTTDKGTFPFVGAGTGINSIVCDGEELYQNRHIHPGYNRYFDRNWIIVSDGMGRKDAEKRAWREVDRFRELAFEEEQRRAA